MRPCALYTSTGRLLTSSRKLSSSHIPINKPKRKCFLFPGMGSQYTGMCKDLYHDFPYIRSFLQEWNDSLGFSITDKMWNSDSKELRQAIYAGPAIWLHSMCIWQILEKEYEIDSALCDIYTSVIGHSAGEYSALTVANLFKKFEDASFVAFNYAKLMHEYSTNEQGMYAILSDDEIDLELLEYTVYRNHVDIANINASNQIIISGLKSNIESTIREFNDHMDVRPHGRLRGKFLQTGGAYHSRFMRPGSVKVEEAFNSVDLNQRLKCDLYLNVIGEKYANHNHDIGQMMAQQIYDRVHWSRCVQKYFTDNESGGSSEDSIEYNFIEIGPKKVLQKMVQSICNYHGYDQTKNLKFLSIDDSKSISSIQSIL